MKNYSAIMSLSIPLFILLSTTLSPQSTEDISLHDEFNLGGTHSNETQYFKMESILVNHNPDGTITETDILRLQLKYFPDEEDNRTERFACVEFTIQKNDEAELEIPALADWSYVYNDSANIDKGYIFGIDHGKFENLTDSKGNPLSFETSYQVYNAFIDFHGFCSLFPEPTVEGTGIQDLKYIGNKIVHAAAYSKAPTNLGKNIPEGSYFQNGKITLEFKGLSFVNDKECALIGFDSGESSFKMIMSPMPNFNIISTGSSHYKGDIYKDLNSGWIQKVEFSEIVIAETSLPQPPDTINAVIEREIIIRNLNAADFVD